MPEDMQQQFVEFERSRAQLVNVSSQKQQLEFQSRSLQQSIEELEKTKEKKVFKNLGSIMVQSDTESMKKEFEEKKESIDLRVKSLQKQEESLMNRLNKLKSEIEKSQKSPASIPGGKEDEKS